MSSSCHTYGSINISALNMGYTIIFFQKIAKFNPTIHSLPEI